MSSPIVSPIVEVKTIDKEVTEEVADLEAPMAQDVIKKEAVTKAKRIKEKKPE